MGLRHLKRIEPNALIYIQYSLLFDIIINLYKPFAVKFLTYMGGTPLDVSRYNSYPGIIAIFAILPGALLISRSKNKKRITAVFFALSRLCLLLIAFIPLLDTSYRPLVFIIILAIMNFPDAISQCSLQSFLGDVLSGRMRGTAISLRNKFSGVVVPLVTLSSGLIISFIPQNEGQTIIVYQIFYVLAFLIGIAEIIVFLKLKEKPVAPVPPSVAALEKSDQADKPTFKTILGTFKNKEFVYYLIPTIIFYFAWQTGWPLISIFQVIEFGASEVWLAIYAVFVGVVSFFASSLWSKLINKKGNNFATILAIIAISMSYASYTLVVNQFMMILSTILGGAATVGVTITLLNGLLQATPDKHRVIYIGVYNTLINVSLAISPMLSNILYEAMGTKPAMLVVSGMRLLSLIPMIILFKKLSKMKKPESDV